MKKKLDINLKKAVYYYMTRKVTYQQLSKGKKMKQLKKKQIKKISKTLKVIVPEVIDEINSRLSAIANLHNKDEYDEQFLGNDQETQDCTKAFQNLASACIQTVCERKNIPLELKEIDGADWVYELDGIEIPLEQKIRSFLGRSEKFHKNMRKYGLPCQSWTGNKHSVYNGKKTDLHLLWSFKIEGSEVVACFASIVSLELTGSIWKTGKGKKDSYATLRINNNLDGGVGIISGSLHTTKKYAYGLLENI